VGRRHVKKIFRLSPFSYHLAPLASFAADG
jgi:hypothetical protein